jgi:molecular chaperone GrpE (heat shock protein)
VPTTEVPEGSIVAELQRGYRIRDRILRPARVAIAASPDSDAAGAAAARPIN